MRGSSNKLKGCRCNGLSGVPFVPVTSLVTTKNNFPFRIN